MELIEDCPIPGMVKLSIHGCKKMFAEANNSDSNARVKSLWDVTLQNKLMYTSLSWCINCEQGFLTHSDNSLIEESNIMKSQTQISSNMIAGDHSFVRITAQDLLKDNHSFPPTTPPTEKV